VRRIWAIAIMLALALSACTSVQGRDDRPSVPTDPDDGGESPSPTADPGWRLVAIGDALARASSCEGCTDFVQLYGEAITEATGMPVEVDERTAVQFSNVPAVQATQLLNDLLTDRSMRDAIADADIVLVNVGFNDTPWNRLDNPCGASNYAATVVRWNEITPACTARVAGEYARTLDEIFTLIDELRGCWTPKGESSTCSERGGRDTLLRLTTVYNDWIGYQDAPRAVLAPSKLADEMFVDAQCWVVAMHGGRCADLFHVLNGPKGNRDAGPYLVEDHTHLNQRGHERVADALIALGLSPLS
jgi:lysophospholipase L1-like esterase